MIGPPLDRLDGPLKVTGRATYSYEERALGEALYGFVVGSPIARGTLARIDTTRARQAPGVRRVLTHHDAPAQGVPDRSAAMPYGRAFPVLAGAEIRAYGQPLALVVAETFEQARAAARLVDLECAGEAGRYALDPADPGADPGTVHPWFPADSAVGDFDAGFAGAPVRIDATYTVPYAHGQPMEPHACLAAWDGEDVTVFVSAQIVDTARQRIASTLQLDPARVHVRALLVGGGFGSKLAVHAETILAVMAARAVGQPVKVALTRQQMFHLVGHRPAARQRLRLAADRDGRLVAFGHDATMKGSRDDDYVEPMAVAGRALYAAPNRLTRHRVVALDLPPSEDVRAPGEAPGLLAIESAMDELAHELRLDPVELRIRNEPPVDPESGLPFGGRRLVECLREGARRFGWEPGPRTPGQRRDGPWLVGHGMAVAIRPHIQLATSVRVRLEPDGSAVVESDMTDIGTGTRTILAQVAAEELGLPVERVRVELGRSEHPTSAGSGGSFGASNATVAVHRACRALQRSEAIGSVPDQQADPRFLSHAQFTYGAHFVEVRVDADTGEIRVTRMLGVFAAGRILNAKTARSQLIGGMIWGLSAALHEGAVVDPRSGAFVNRDLAEYLVPVHADVPAVEAIVLDDVDDAANELGVKGIGELGICGAGAAVGNAVFDATGVRVRDFPITLDRVLAELP